MTDQQKTHFSVFSVLSVLNVFAIDRRGFQSE
jgi:hypothetical protein